MKMWANAPKIILEILGDMTPLFLGSRKGAPKSKLKMCAWSEPPKINLGEFGR
jgi:hypothetical protein